MAAPVRPSSSTARQTEGLTLESHPDAILQVDRLTRAFGGRDAVRSLSFELGAGDRLALRGPNGSGKTTILRCIAGTLTPTSGSIRVGGHPSGTKQARGLIGASLSQERSFYLRLTGQANLLFYARLRSPNESAAQERVRDVEDELELSSILATRLDRCSTGMLQQVAVARALLFDPPVLLLDEPTRSMDDAAIDRFWHCLARRPASAVVVATHRREDLEHCDRVIDLAS